MTDIVEEALAVANELSQLHMHIDKLEKAIAIYVREAVGGNDFKLDYDAINYFCEKYND